VKRSISLNACASLEFRLGGSCDERWRWVFGSLGCNLSGVGVNRILAHLT
jgi:hypothetical protein